MIKLTVLVNTCILMVHSMKGPGRKINNMEREKKPGLMVPAIKVTMLMEKKMVQANLDGLIVQLMKVSS